MKAINYQTMKKASVIASMLLFPSMASAQLTVGSDGCVGIGANVTSEMPTGNVTIVNNGMLNLGNKAEVTITKNFKCEIGGKLNINKL